MERKGHYIMIRQSILQEDIQSLIQWNNKALKPVRQKVIKLQGNEGESPLVVGDFKTPLAEIDRSNRQKINRHSWLNNTINQLDIMDIHRLFYSTTAEYTFFSS